MEGAQQTCSPSALHSWIYRSVREPAAKVIRSLGVGAPIDKVLSKLKLAYGIVLTFDELVTEFLNVFQFTTQNLDTSSKIDNVDTYKPTDLQYSIQIHMTSVKAASMSNMNFIKVGTLLMYTCTYLSTQLLLLEGSRMVETS